MADLKNTTINDTGFFRFPVGTTVERPSSPTTSMIRVNTDRSSAPVLEFYDGIEWIVFAGYAPISASGGSESVIDAGGVDYRVHVFSGNDTFTVNSTGSSDPTVEFLVVGGGAGGGGDGSTDGGSAVAESGESNTGGGGAGRESTPGAGGSGIVIIRYLP